MKTLLLRLFHNMASVLRDRVHLALEALALQHQLAVLKRSGKRPHCSPADRCVWVLLSTVCSRWTAALEIVHPDTVRRWRRQGLRKHVRWKRGQKRPGRPAIASETRALIRRMSRDNVLWGAPRIHGELLKLGVRVSRTTVAKYMERRPGPLSPRWGTFLRHHVPDLVSRRTSAYYMQRLRAFYIEALHTLHRTLDKGGASGEQGTAGREVIRLPWSAPAAVPTAWPLGTMERSRGCKRAPPAHQLSPYGEPRPTGLGQDVGMVHLRLAASAMRHWSVHRQGKCPTIGQARGVSQRVAA